MRLICRVTLAILIIAILTGCQKKTEDENGPVQETNNLEEVTSIIDNTQSDENGDSLKEESAEDKNDIDNVGGVEQVVSVEEANESNELTISIVEHNSDDIWDAELMEAVSVAPIQELGFLGKTSHAMWYLEINNAINVAYKNLKIDYTVRIYKHDVKFGIDYADVVSYDLQLFGEFSKSVIIDDLLELERKEYDIAYLGTIPYIEIEIDGVSIDNKLLDIELPIVEYIYPEFNYLDDSQHLRELLGVNYLIEELMKE